MINQKYCELLFERKYYLEKLFQESHRAQAEVALDKDSDQQPSLIRCAFRKGAMDDHQKLIDDYFSTHQRETTYD